MKERNKTTLHVVCIFADVEMKERKKTTLHLVCIFADVGSSLPCFCTFFSSIPT